MRRLPLIVLFVLGCAREEAPAITHHDEIAQTAQSSVDSLATPAPISTTGEASRNIFAYREPPPVVVVAKKPAVIVQTQAPVSIQNVVQTREPEAPPFAYRCLGTFGSDTHRFAVFTNGEGVVNVAIGDVVGSSQFVLREIGVESVTVAANTFTKRIEIGR